MQTLIYKIVLLTVFSTQPKLQVEQCQAVSYGSCYLTAAHCVSNLKVEKEVHETEDLALIKSEKALNAVSSEIENKTTNWTVQQSDGKKAVTTALKLIGNEGYLKSGEKNAVWIFEGKPLVPTSGSPIFYKDGRLGFLIKSVSEKDANRLYAIELTQYGEWIKRSAVPLQCF